MSIENSASVEKKKRIYADSALVIAALLWGGEYVVAKHALESISPHYLNATRFFLGFCGLSILFHKKLLKINKQDIRAGWMTGIFMFGGYAAQTIGLQYINAGNSAFLSSAYIIMVPFIVWALTKKKPDSHVFFSAAICMIGIGLLTVQENFYISFGDTLTLICAVFFAAMLVSIDYFAKKVDPILLTILQMGFVSILSFGFALFSETFPVIRGFVWLEMIYLVILGTIATQLLTNIAMKYSVSNHASIIFSLESVFAILFAFIFLKERLTLRMGIGCILIFLAILITETRPRFLRPSKSHDSFLQ